MLPVPVASHRRSAHLAISIPGNPPPSLRPSFKPSGRILFRYLPWVAGAIIILWLFVLRSDNPPLDLSSEHNHANGGFLYTRPPYRPAGGPPVHAPEHSQDEPESPPQKPKWWPGSHGKSLKKTPTVWDGRAEKVKNAFVHAYEGYLRYAKGFDELLPVGGGKVNNFNGWGVTLFDALDTMWIMGLHQTFRESLVVVAKTDFYLKPGDQFAPFFETVIRYLGGLLSAYALSGEPILLTRADDLGRKLLPAFDTQSGFPMYAVNTVSGETRQGWSGSVLWAETLSNQMEYKYLAHLTGRTEYFNKTEHIMRQMAKTTLKSGLFPTMWDMSSGTPSNEQYSVGAFADSAYEYLLKQWLLTSRTEPKALELYLNSVNGIISNMLYVTPNRYLLYVTDVSYSSNSFSPSHKFEHLSCFLPGMLALGVHTLPEDALSKKDRERHLWAAEGLAETCWVTYFDSKTGLGPDEMRMEHWQSPSKREETDDSPDTRAFWDTQLTGQWLTHVEKWEREGREGGKPPGVREVQRETDPEKRDWKPLKGLYLLRPETIESFYVLWKTTGDVKWRERGWAVFESIEKHARTKYGYASIHSVDAIPPQYKDEMPSYFLAETLKYLYLLFSEEDLIPFEHWVFNTEAHPLPIFNWAPWEKEEYGINTGKSWFWPPKY